MSYRALVTIINQAANGDFLHVADFKLGLNDDFKNGEEVAELLAAKRSRLDALQAAYDDQLLTSVSYGNHAARQAWIDTYADQVWTIKFREVGISGLDVEITGTEANGDMIFFRSIKYVL